MRNFILRSLIVIMLVSGFILMKRSSQRVPNPEEKLLAANVHDSVLINAPFDTAHFNIRLHPQGSYADALKNIAQLRMDLKNQLTEEANADSLLLRAGKSLENKIVNTVLPFWYGTEWDFYGTTDTPRVGKIACGYLVSTVLKHCGFNLNRYTMAQQSAWNEARTLQLADKVQYIKGDYENFAQKFKEIYHDGLYLVGLDFHVGLLLLREGEVFFIHSSYISPAVTVIEPIAESQAFQASRGYHLAEISTNTKLIKKWIMQEKVEVRRD